MYKRYPWELGRAYCFHTNYGKTEYREKEIRVIRVNVATLTDKRIRLYRDGNLERRKLKQKRRTEEVLASS
jgi:hypothetical protein